ncbi:hypothetical protein GJ698_02915 [Pseudoduganella sp. FT26W]|uniref:RiboL-PSP-HEPN domain-containing protein n=1 Tax=Duganella aquatilis TaxID=2666082 RepID=A0A844CW93_9BURK|nr:HEPN domain-containing protein [Duganella aquatilis]MRW83041.1 hypothetical protein [Duganella aquatilis]
MPNADLDGPLVDFNERTKQVREIMAVVEAASRSPGILTTSRAGIDLSAINIRTANTANSMALIFLASGFEDFIREEAVQCANYLMDKYSGMPEASKHSIRDTYWIVSRERLKFMKSVLVKKLPDAALIAQVKTVLDALDGFVVKDDSTKMSTNVFGFHTNNFRPNVVAEIFGRLEIKQLGAQLSDSAKLKGHFGVTKKTDCEIKLLAKWNEFYDRRNDTVHSLGGSSGYAIELIIGYIEFFELTAEALKGVLAKTLETW